MGFARRTRRAKWNPKSRARIFPRYVGGNGCRGEPHEGKVAAATARAKGTVMRTGG